MKKFVYLELPKFCLSLIFLVFISGCNTDKRENNRESDTAEIDTLEVKTLPVHKSDTQIVDVSVSLPPPPPPQIPPIRLEPPPIIEETQEISSDRLDEISSPIAESHAIESDEERIYMFVEQMPEFPGGEPALYEYISDNIFYPAKAKEDHIEGRVNIRFVIDKNGRINNVIVMKSSGNVDLDKEAERIIKRMPYWKPGKQNGRAVSVYFTLPVNFKLED